MPRGEKLQIGKFTCLGACIFLIALNKQGNTWKGSIHQENGVTVVENPEKPLYSSEEVFRLREEYVIRSSSDSYQLDKPFQLLLDASKNLYVLDNQESNIKVFDNHGRFLRLIGRKGVGPEELEHPARMTIAKNRLVVFSPQISRMTIFDLDGRFIDSRHYPMGLTEMRADSQGNLFCIKFTRTNEISDLRVLQKYDADLNFQRELASQAARPVNRWFSVQGPMFTVTRDDKIIYGFPDTYELLIFFNDGRLIGRIRKKYRAIRIPPEEIEFLMKNFHSPGFEVIFPKFYEPFCLIHNDDEGRLFVTTIRKAAHVSEDICDVFGPDGRFLATISLRSDPRRLWANGGLYEVAEDEEALPTIKVSRVIWNY